MTIVEKAQIIQRQLNDLTSRRELQTLFAGTAEGVDYRSDHSMEDDLRALVARILVVGATLA